jgi:predicted dehydrogenase
MFGDSITVAAANVNGAGQNGQRNFLRNGQRNFGRNGQRNFGRAEQIGEKGMKGMKIGIIGYGGMAEHHIGHYIKGYNRTYGKTDGPIEIAGIYDIDRARVEKARRDGLYIFESAQALLGDKGTDAVLIATPNDSHAPYAVEAARAGKHMLVEKPVTLSAALAEEMFAAARAAGVVLTVHQNRRWDPDYLTVKAIIRENALAGVYRLESRVMGSNGIPGAWRRVKEQGGGMLYDWGVHQIDQLLELIPAPVVSVLCEFSYIAGEPVDDAYRLSLRFENGVGAYVETDTNTFIPLPRWQVYGADGTATITDWELNGRMVVVQKRRDEGLAVEAAGNGFTKTMARRRAETVTEPPLPKVESDPFALYKNFVLAAAGKAAPLVTPDSVLRTLRVIEAAFLSGRENRVVAVNI